MAKNIVNKTVEEMISELKANPTSRFSKNDFQVLVYAVLSDKNFNAKKYALKDKEIIEETVNYNQAINRFMDKLLKHAGMADASERTAVIDTFEYGSRDIEWIIDAVDEAMHIYTECGMTMRMFRDKMLQLSVKKIVRSGKYEGKVSYKKSVIDRFANMQKRMKD